MMDNTLYAIGLMSGTSLDGIDSSILSSDGEEKTSIIGNKYLKYPKPFRDKLSKYIKKISSKEDILKSKLEFKEIERELTILHSKICIDILSEFKIDVDLIGFHGQTIIHRPKLGYSIQMGDPNLLSQLTKKKVIFDFRQNDIINKGEGAPLTPIYHYILFKKLNFKKPVMFMNIGGITNITYCEKENFFAKDIGPGNVLIDEYLKKTKNILYDKGGEIALSGNVDFNLINQFIEHELYNKNDKHSFDRSEFDFNFVRGLEFENSVATLTYFTANILSNYINKNFKNEIDIMLCGGGRYNLTLVKFLKKLTKNNILYIDDYGLNGDFIESQAFAFLGIRSLLKKKLTYPSTTNVTKPITGGKIYKNF